MVCHGLDFPDGPVWLGLFVALYTLTAHGDGRRSLVIAGVGIVVLATAWLIAAGPYRTIADVEKATASWVHWYNYSRLHSTLGLLALVGLVGLEPVPGDRGRPAAELGRSRSCPRHRSASCFLLPASALTWPVQRSTCRRR